jgi:hypothetical protein
MIGKIMPLIGGIARVQISGMISRLFNKNGGEWGLARPLLHPD